MEFSFFQWSHLHCANASLSLCPTRTPSTDWIERFLLPLRWKREKKKKTISSLVRSMWTSRSRKSKRRRCALLSFEWIVKSTMFAYSSSSLLILLFCFLFCKLFGLCSCGRHRSLVIRINGEPSNVYVCIPYTDEVTHYIDAALMLLVVVLLLLLPL